MSNEIKIKHAGVDITYDERSNRWKFELNGRERSAESLENAKKFINNPPKEKKEQKFERIEAWMRSRGFGNREGFELVTVTSFAETRFSAAEAWVVDGKKNRRKEYCYNLFPKNAHNDALVSQSVSLESQIDDLREQQEKIESKLNKLEPPKDEPQQ